MSGIKINWEAEVPKRVAEYFNSIGVTYQSSTPLYTALVDFMNMDLKLINPKPRKVYKSREFLSRAVQFGDIRGVNNLVDKINRGFDINYHQSRKVLDPKHNDLLLNDWVIYHFHIGIEKEKDGFFERTKNLVFAMFSSKEAYFIDIRPHGKHGEPDVFAKQEFLEIVDRNWPHILTIHDHEDAVFFNNRYTDSDINILRKKGYAIGTTCVNGKIVINPGIGITTSGHNTHVIKRANEVVRYLHGAVSEVEKDPEAVRQSLSKEVGVEIPELDLQIQRVEKWPFFAVYENNSKCYIEKRYDQAV